MPKENIIDFLFDARENNNSLLLDDELLEELDTTIELAEDNLMNLINKKIHPKCRTELQKLIKQKENKIYDYLYRENQLVYRKGVSDGIKLMIAVLV